MPISRVRSTTDTSMIFMMPMPPTTSEMPTDACHHCGKRRADLAERGADLLRRLDMEVVRLAGLQTVRMAQQARYADPQRQRDPHLRQWPIGWRCRFSPAGRSCCATCRTAAAHRRPWLMPNSSPRLSITPTTLSHSPLSWTYLPMGSSKPSSSRVFSPSYADAATALIVGRCQKTPRLHECVVDVLIGMRGALHCRERHFAP